MSQSVEDVARVPTPLGLPGIGLAEMPAVADQHEQRDLVQQGARHDAVDGLKETVVLHQHRRANPGEVSSRGDADPLFLLGQSHQRHVRIVLGHANEVYEPGLWKRRHDPHVYRFQRL